jgi:hypothetical protein
MEGMKTTLKSLLNTKVPTLWFVLTCAALSTVLLSAKLLTDRVISNEDSTADAYLKPLPQFPQADVATAAPDPVQL